MNIVRAIVPDGTRIKTNSSSGVTKPQRVDALRDCPDSTNDSQSYVNEGDSHQRVELCRL
jgi:hypothetical protein